MENVLVLKTLLKENDSLRIEKNEILSDYLEDVNRIIKCMSTVYISSKNIYPSPTGLKVDIEGVCSFNITYLGVGTDKKEKLCLARVSERFTHQIDMGQNSDMDRENLWGICEGIVKESSCRPLGPRKLQLLCDIDFNVCIKGNKSSSFSELTCDKGVQQKISKEKIGCLKDAFSDQMSLKDSFNLPESYPEIDKLLEYDAKMFCKNLKLKDKQFEFEALCVLYCCYLPKGNEGDNPSPVSFIQPIAINKRFNKEYDLTSCFGLCDIRICDLLVSCDDKEALETKCISFKVDAVCDCAIVCDTECEVCTDAFSTEYKTELIKQNKRAERIISVTPIDEKCQLVFPIRSENAVKCECVRASAEVISCKLDGNKIDANMKFYVNLINVSEDSKLFYQYETSIVEIGFNVNDLPESLSESSSLSLEIFCDVKQTEAKYDKENICVFLVVDGSVVISEQYNFQCVDELKCNEKIENKGENIVFCYPEVDDSSWDIAKRYCVEHEVIKQEMAGKDKGDILRIIA